MENKKYLEQFKRIERWYKELKKGHLGSPKSCFDNDIYYEDLLYAFFQNCFHLQDWLINSNVITKEEGRIFIESHKDMKICRDLCNASKHLVFNETASIDRNIRAEVKQVSLSMDLGTGKSRISNVYIIRADGGVYHAFDVATRCLGLWKKILENKGLK